MVFEKRKVFILWICLRVRIWTLEIGRFREHIFYIGTGFASAALNKGQRRARSYQSGNRNPRPRDDAFPFWRRYSA
jgi:hypothetical protein